MPQGQSVWAEDLKMNKHKIMKIKNEETNFLQWNEWWGREVEDIIL